MAVIFESTIKNDGLGGWYIELKDTTDGRVEICKDLTEYEEKIEELGADYGGHIDEVKWLADDDVTPIMLDELRLQMAAVREKIEEEKGEFITPVGKLKDEE
jgi:hypothetical protein